MPSETDTVLKIIGAPPASRAPCLTRFAKSLKCILQGVTSLHVLALPIIGFLKSSSVNPTARSIARFGAFVVLAKILLRMRKSLVIVCVTFLFIYLHYILIFGQLSLSISV